MRKEKFESGPFSENCYLVWDENNNDALIIDPGILGLEEEERFETLLEERKLIPRYIVNTHCHLDHIFGNAFLKRRYPEAILMASSKDLRLLKQAKEQGKTFGVECEESPLPDVDLDTLKEIKIASITFELLFTPGHTPGSYSLLNREHKICYTGDVLFRGSIGRTDLWGGSLQTLMESIQGKLLTLDDDITVYPGHGTKTTIGYERANNPFFF